MNNEQQVYEAGNVFSPVAYLTSREVRTYTKIIDRHKPYKRNGKLYFRPYRNYFNTNYDNEVWGDLRYLGFAECDCNYWEEEKKKSVFFWLNEDGRKWLAEKLGIYKIWEERG